MYSNFYPIQIPFEEFSVQRVKGDSTLLSSLRSKYNSTHSFFKLGEYIYISNKSGEELEIGESVFLKVSENERVVESLIKHIFFKTYIERFPKYRLQSFYPFRVLSKKADNDLLSRFLPQEYKGRFTYSRLLTVHLRSCYIDRQLRFGFTVNTSIEWDISITCQELVDKQFDVIGLEVNHSLDPYGLGQVIVPDETFIGEIQSVNGNNAEVKCVDGVVTIPLKELFLKKTRINRQKLLGFILGDENKAEAVLSDVVNDGKSQRSLESIEKSIRGYAGFLFREKGSLVRFENRHSFCFTVEENRRQDYGSFNLENPLFVFDPSQLKTHPQNDMGLRTYGPYDSGQFSPKELNITVFCMKNNRGRMATFLGGLINGDPQSKYFKVGLEKKYLLHSVTVNIIELDAYTIDEIKSRYRGVSEIPDLVLLEIPASHKSERNPNNSLYYLAKGFFLSLQIPIQIVNTENIINYNEYKLNAIALQIYAKVGGLPWTIQVKDSVDKEIIVGISHSIQRSSTYSGNTQERVVGISTFFNADGKYLMSGEIKDVSYEEYFDELLKNLQASIEKFSKTYAWKENDTIRFIFHIFKPLKNIEFEVIQELIKSFPKLKIQFAFVRISERHPFLLFDETQRGRKMGRKTIGALTPSRGSNIVVDKSTCVLQTLGIREMKTDRHGSSKPLQIRILLPTDEELAEELKPLLFHDLHYIIQQVYKFSTLSWRGFMPNHKPATVLYSSLIARALGKLRQLPTWNPAHINQRLKFKKWFL